LIETRKPTDPEISVVSVGTFLEFVTGHVVHQLGKYSATGVHRDILSMVERMV
jgi:hypothetical protein